jgi:legumain
MFPFRSALIAAFLLLTAQAEDLEQPEKSGHIWAVIVAGSRSWYNYRHQSDVCHLYHLLTKQHGIPKRNVITMMYNDIAFNEENPHRGHIFNALHGKDVYEGVMIDYMGEDVNPQNFLDILMGQNVEVGSGKTLKSGPKDTVFVNFVDHGAPGVLGFPSDELHLVDLKKVLHSMYTKKRYKQMLWYVEACYSGSMFNKLRDDMNITAHTAANEEESSYACALDEKMGVYLGDCWSLNWINNTERFFPNLKKETVGQQYEIVKKMTNESHASIYGDLTYIYEDPISTFLGHSKEDFAVAEVRKYSHQSTATPDIMLEYLKWKRQRSNDKDEAEKLDQEIDYHIHTEGKVQKILEQISHQVTGSWDKVKVFSRHPQTIEHPECNKDVLSAFFSQCYKMQTHPYITKYLYRLTNLCNAFNGKDIVSAVVTNCNQN